MIWIPLKTLASPHDLLTKPQVFDRAIQHDPMTKKKTKSKSKWWLKQKCSFFTKFSSPKMENHFSWRSFSSKMSLGYNRRPSIHLHVYSAEITFVFFFIAIEEGQLTILHAYTYQLIKPTWVFFHQKLHNGKLGNF